jgi:hypothetical protein
MLRRRLLKRSFENYITITVKDAISGDTFCIGNSVLSSYFPGLVTAVEYDGNITSYISDINLTNDGNSEIKVYLRKGNHRLSYVIRDNSLDSTYDFSNIKEESIKSFYSFASSGNCANVTCIGLDRQKPSSFERCLAYASGVTNDFISSLDMSNAETLRDFFLEANIEDDIDLSNQNLDNVLDMSSFAYSVIANSHSLNFGENTLKKVTTYKASFLWCKFKCDLSKLDTSNVTDMNYMFNYAKVGQDGLSGYGNFNTKNVTGMSCMFYYASTSDDWIEIYYDTSSLVEASYMFKDCYNSVRFYTLNAVNEINMKNAFYISPLSKTYWVTIYGDISKIHFNNEKPSNYKCSIRFTLNKKYEDYDYTDLQANLPSSITFVEVEE